MNKNLNTSESFWVKFLLTFLALLFILIVLIVPLLSIFIYAFEKGYEVYIESITDPIAVSAMQLTFLAVFFTVPLNLIFGVAASWAIARFEFIGRNLLISLIDIPFSVSPIISGMIYVLIFGTQGYFGEYLYNHDIKIIFATPGIVLVTIFVTFPFIARELIPIMQSLGSEEEEAAIILGATGWQTFWKVTLPNIKWGILYGVILCNARAMGEFGAVSVVSGHIRGLTNTIPLHVEILYNEYNYVGAFAVASILTLAAIATLIVKETVNYFSHKGERT
ncbi:MAG: sulfate ABC transporter permease subunit CysW [Leptospiraceae bacterium]|nr:sulfate ABC transporter permease subunit CysW [Leptospiraceae bacterium]